MKNQLSRTDLAVLVEHIMSAQGTESELNEMIALLSANVPHPLVTDLIFYPNSVVPSAEQVVDQALAYKPVIIGNQAGA